MKTNEDGTISIPEPTKKEVKVIKSKITKNFEKFNKHIVLLKAPKVRKLYNPNDSLILTDKEYLKRYNQISLYYNTLHNDIYNSKKINIQAKQLKDRVSKYATKLIKDKLPSLRLKNNPGDIAIETDTDYETILNLSNDMYLYSLENDKGLTDEDKLLKRDKTKALNKVSDKKVEQNINQILKVLKKSVFLNLILLLDNFKNNKVMKKLKNLNKKLKENKKIKD